MNHLHVHSEYSALDGLSDVKALVKRAKEIGSSALAITDHGVCGAIPDFIEACVAEGIKPIPGCEAYMTKDRTLKGDFLKEERESLCDKYGFTMKEFMQFRKEIRNTPESFEYLAGELIKEYLMNGCKPVTESKKGKSKEKGKSKQKKISLEEEAANDLFNWKADEVTFDQEEVIPEVRVDFDDIIFDNEDENTQPIKIFKKEFYALAKHDNFHILLIAINNQGLKDLYQIVSDAHINGFYSNPRTDLSYIKENGLGKNIIATSACLGSYYARFALAGMEEECIDFINECKETFHSFYLEKQATSIESQIILNSIIDKMAIETDTGKVVTTDVHYANKDDNEIHDILVASSMGKCISDKDRMTYAHEFWMKSEDEVRSLVNDDEAIRNTQLIADMVDVTMSKKPLFPKFIVEEGDTSETILKKQSWDGLFRYAIDHPEIDIEAYCQRMSYELEVINTAGFADYFLIVADFVNWARLNGFLVGPGRGSAAGSLVVYIIGITELDPIKWDLMFERFLNPERAGYPDIDIDFSYAGAQAVQQYMKEKYGVDRVAQIGTYSTMAGRLIIKTVGKVLGHTIQDQNKYASLIPEKPGIKLDQRKDKNGKMVPGAYQESSALRVFAEENPKWWSSALALEGHVKTGSVHAGGIVLSPEPLTNTVPLRLDKEGLITTQYSMNWIEKLLVKFDILKLDTLDIIKLAKQYAGIDMDLKYIDYNDPKIYEEVYSKLFLSGIFQCESNLFRGIIGDMQPTSVEDISVIVALGRPGPMDLIPTYVRRKKGLEKVTFPFDSLSEVLGKTYGVWVYQEQIMKASIILGGFTAGQSDILRKAISKKNMELMEEWIGYMIYGSNEHKIKGAIASGYDEAMLLKIKADWIKFGDYCFNYAHSACYAVLSVQTAWLKTYYPAAFMAALLTVSEGKKDSNQVPKAIAYMKECREIGMDIVPPNINISEGSWTPVSEEGKKDRILYGMSSIAGVTEKDLIALREHRPFKGFDEFLEKTKEMSLNKTKVTALIKSGSFDEILDNRNYLMLEYTKYRGDDYDHIPTTTTKKDIIEYERKYLGANVSIESRWDGIEDGKANITFTGQLVEVAPFKAAKTGTWHCKGKIETKEDEINLMVFNATWSKHKEEFIVGRKVQLKGKKSGNDLLVDSIKFVDEMAMEEQPHGTN